MSFFKKLVPLKAEMNMLLENMDIGQPLRGVASLESRDKFRVEYVRSEIRVTEHWKETRMTRNARGGMSPSTVDVHSTRYSQDIPISESFDITNGEKKDFPFEVTIPMYQPMRGQITHSLKAVANVKGRPDVTKEIKL